jgi:hypothetical protein
MLSVVGNPETNEYILVEIHMYGDPKTRIVTQKLVQVADLTGRFEKDSYSSVPTNAICKIVEWMPRDQKAWLMPPEIDPFPYWITGWHARICETKKLNDSEISLRVEVRPMMRAERGAVYCKGYLIEEWTLSAGKGLVFKRLIGQLPGEIITN